MKFNKITLVLSIIIFSAYIQCSEIKSKRNSSPVKKSKNSQKVLLPKVMAAVTGVFSVVDPVAKVNLGKCPIKAIVKKPKKICKKTKDKNRICKTCFKTKKGKKKCKICLTNKKRKTNCILCNSLKNGKCKKIKKKKCKKGKNGKRKCKKKNYGRGVKALKSTVKPFNEVMGILGPKLNGACAFRTLISRYIARRLKKRKNKSKEKIKKAKDPKESKVKTKAPNWWKLKKSGFLSLASNHFRNIGSHWKRLPKHRPVIKKHAKLMYKKLRRGIKHAYTFVKQTFNQIRKSIKLLRKGLIGFFRGKIFRMMRRVLRCLVKSKKLSPRLRYYTKRLRKGIKILLHGRRGFAFILSRAICRQMVFKKAIEEIVVAMNSKGQNRWSKVGRFIGYFALAVVGEQKKK